MFIVLRKITDIGFVKLFGIVRRAFLCLKPNRYFTNGFTTQKQLYNCFYYCYTFDMKKLSVVIMTFNEEKKIKECLESIKGFADEIIVVDNNSSDKTVSIAKKYTKKIYSQENKPLILDLQKNYGFSKATSEWILSLDADERVSPALAFQINAATANANGEITGYRIPRKNIIFGKWMQHTGWYPDFQLRLFKNGKGKYALAHVHEEMAIEGKIEQLTEPLFHENFETVGRFIQKHMVYAENEAASKREKGYTYHWSDAINLPATEFISRFFAREGYKDGFHGLMLSLLMAWYHFMIFSFLWQEEKFVEAGSTDILTDTQNVLQGVSKDVSYWFIQEKIKQTRSFSKRIVLKLRRKLS